jgi:hypothetical protein
VQECRQLTNLAELKWRHDLPAAQMGVPIPSAHGADAVFEEQRREHQRFSEFQLQRRIYQPLSDGESYAPTEKARARGIWNHFNPFSRRISWSQLVFSALIGSFLSLPVILKITPLLTEEPLGAFVPISSQLPLLPPATLWREESSAAFPTGPRSTGSC